MFLRLKEMMRKKSMLLAPEHAQTVGDTTFYFITSSLLICPSYSEYVIANLHQSRDSAEGNDGKT